MHCIVTMEREISDGQPIEGARLCVAALGAESCLAASPPIWGYLRLWLDETETHLEARRLSEPVGIMATKTSRFGYLRECLGFRGAPSLGFQVVGCEVGVGFGPDGGWLCVP